MHKLVIAMTCAAALALVSELPVKAADNATPQQANSPTSAPSAASWCGFKDTSGSIVRCGFSTFAQCKAAVGEDKDSYCILDPKFAQNLAPIGNVA